MSPALPLELAFQSLRQAADDRSEMLLFLPFEPKFDSLRRDRRFQQLLRSGQTPSGERVANIE